MRLWRWTYRCLGLLLWCAVAAIGLEFAETVKDVWAERDAARMMSAMRPPAPDMRPATPEELAALRQTGSLPALSTGRASAPPSPDVDKTLLGEGLVTRYEALRKGMDEDTRNARAALDGECWMLFDERGQILESFGDPDVALRGIGCGVPTRLDDCPLLSQVQPLVPGRIRNESNPLWDYEITRAETPDPLSGAPRTIVLLRSLTLNISIGDLSALYADRAQSHLLVPSYIDRPNYDDGRVITDQFGFVNRPVTLPKPAGTIRIVCIGGSTTHEAEVGGERTTSFLQQLMENQFSGHRVEIINCGIAGSSSFEMRRHARDYLRYEPDLILYYEGINDVMGLLNLRPYQIAPLRRNLLRSKVLREWFNRSLLVDDQTFATYWRTGTRRNLLAIRLAAEEAGVPMAAASFTYVRRALLSWREWNFIQFNARTTWGGGFATYDTIAHLLDLHNVYLKELCEEHQIGYIPLAENFDHGMTHFRDLCHFAPVGMQERARILQTWLASWLRKSIEDPSNVQ